MRARVLGQFELEDDLGPVRLPSKNLRTLLELLLLRPDDVVTAEAIVATLWPGADPNDAAVARRLHTSVSRLRSFLRAEPDDPDALAVVSAEGGYLLRASPAALDRVAFEELVAEVVRRPNGDAGLEGSIEQALAGWHGEPYTGFTVTPEVLAERARLQEARQALLQRRQQLHGGRSSSDQLLSVKLRRPRVDAASMIRRPRLVSRIPDVGRTTLVALEAPVGYGKSVLLSEWAQEQSAPVAWFGLDPADGDPVRFWRSFTAAVGLAAPNRLTDIDASVPPGSPPHLRALAAALDREQTPIGIVIDDLHLIEDAEPPEQLAVLLGMLPEHVTVAVGSRQRLEVLVDALPHRPVHVVDPASLRFDAAEVERFCASAASEGMAAALTPTVLHERTGGWPVAVASLVRAGSTRLDTPEDLRLDRDLVDQLLAELPTDVRSFLLDTALLDRLCRDLCDAVTGRGDAGAALTWLRRHELFLIESVEDSSWYRYHDLVRDELRRVAELQHGGDLAERHQRAARWYLAHGLDEEALHHAVLAGDRSIIAPTSGEVLLAAALRGETATSRSWMERLDPDIVAADPRSHAVAMVTAVLWIEIDGRARWMRSRHRHFGGADDVILTYARAVDGADQGRATEAVELTQRALEGAESFSRMYAADLARAVAGTALSNLVLARMMQGTLRHDDPLLPNTVSLLRPEVPIMAAWIHLYWGLVALVDGDDDLAGALSAEFSAGTEGIVLAGARGPTTMIEGILAADRTDDPARLRAMAEHLLPAIETYSALGAETRAAITRYTAAFLFRRAGDLDRAAEERDRADLALRTFVDAPFVERFRDHLDARYASRPAGDAASPQLVEPLTDRELTVLRELATTRSPAEIADALHLSVHTVRSHTRAIYRKFSVGSRHGAVLRARELGY